MGSVLRISQGSKYAIISSFQLWPKNRMHFRNTFRASLRTCSGEFPMQSMESAVSHGWKWWNFIDFGTLFCYCFDVKLIAIGVLINVITNRLWKNLIRCVFFSPFLLISKVEQKTTFSTANTAHAQTNIDFFAIGLDFSFSPSITKY